MLSLLGEACRVVMLVLAGLCKKCNSIKSYRRFMVSSQVANVNPKQ